MSALARSPAPREKAAPSYPAERQAAAGGRMGLQQAGGGGNELVQQRLAAQEKEGDPGAADAPVGSPAGGTDGMGDGGGRPDGWGTPLASHRGVTAFSNGGDVNYGERSTYGLSYQCVEYVNRFASEALGLGNMAGTGNAKDYAGEGRSGLTWVPNVPGPHLPTDGDILVFQGGTYGHVAVATSGGPGGVRMIQQNSRSVYGDLGVTGGEGSWSVKAWGSYALLGWQHPGSLPEGKSAGGSSGGTYTVQAGDTLSAIAGRLLGDSSRYMEIAAANGIANPSQIRVGQVLTIPGTGQAPAPAPAPVEPTPEPTPEPVPPTPFEEFLTKVEAWEAPYSKNRCVDLHYMITQFRKVFSQYDTDNWNTYLLPESPKGALEHAAPDVAKEPVIELPDGTKTDIGHIATGLDALVHPSAVDGPFLADIGSNAGAVTWIGDLASVLAEAHHAGKVGDADLETKMMELFGDSDLAGDVDAYAIHAMAQTTTAASVSDLLRKFYLGEKPATRTDRTRVFAQGIGLEGSGPTFTNRDAWISDHVDDVNDAAGMYAGAKWGKVAAVKTMIQGKLAKKLLGSFVDRIGKMVAAEPAPTVS